MNKYHEALKTFKHVIWKLCSLDDTYYQEEFELEEKALKELVDKATPMKPKIHIDNKKESKRVYACPRCGNSCLKKWANERNVNRYCWDCGQALDWSQDDNPHR